MVGGEAVDEQDRLAEVAPSRRDVDEGDVDAVGGEGLQHRTPIWPVFSLPATGADGFGQRIVSAKVTSRTADPSPSQTRHSFASSRASAGAFIVTTNARVPGAPGIEPPAT